MPLLDITAGHFIFRGDQSLSHRRRLFFFLPRAKDELPLFSSPLFPLILTPLFFLSHPLPLEVGPLSTARGSGGAL